MFGLKQICANDMGMKLKVGTDMFPPLLAVLETKEHREVFESGQPSSEFLFQAVGLLQMLLTNCFENSHKYRERTMRALTQVRNNYDPVVGKINGFRARFDGLLEELARQAA